MTDKDKELICDYMKVDLYIEYINSPYTTKRIFDTNFASRCIDEMQKRRGDYVKFIKVAYGMASNAGNTQFHTITAWLFNANNFFASMAKWLKKEKKRTNKTT